MTLSAIVINRSIRNVSRILCRIDDSQLERVPRTGPLIIVSNHINFLDVPVVYSHLLPRPLTGFVKSETWDNQAMAFLFNLWDGIPVRRGEADVAAFQRGVEALSAGKILAIAPEGTRSGDGRLKRGLPGVVTITQLSHAPILPIAFYGGEKFRDNLSHLRRTDFKIAVGRMFCIKSRASRYTRDERQAIADEIMLQIAALIPPDYHGYYAGRLYNEPQYLDFIPFSIDQSITL